MTSWNSFFTKKAIVCKAYKDELLCHENFVENTGDEHWGKGKVGRPGRNTLGKLHNKVRASLYKHVFIVGDSVTRDLLKVAGISTNPPQLLPGCSKAFGQHGVDTNRGILVL